MSDHGTGGGQGGLAFRLGSIPVHMPWSSLLGIGVVAFLWMSNFSVVASSRTETAVLAVVFAVLFYLTILGHELAHAWVAGICGYPVHSITLWALGGFTAYDRRTSSRSARASSRRPVRCRRSSSASSSGPSPGRT